MKSPRRILSVATCVLCAFAVVAVSVMPAYAVGPDPLKSVIAFLQRLAMRANDLDTRLGAVETQIQSLPSGGGLKVVDSLGQEIGPYVGVSQALFESGGTQFSLGLFVGGFAQSPPSFFYESSNCTGQPYMISGPGTVLAPSLQVVGTTGYYPLSPTVQITYLSAEFLGGPGCFTVPSFPPPLPVNAHVVGQIDLAVFVPPFHIAVP